MVTTIGQGSLSLEGTVEQERLFAVSSVVRYSNLLR